MTRKRKTTFIPGADRLENRDVPTLLGGLGGLLGGVLTDGAIISTQPGPEVQNEVDYQNDAGTWGGQGNPDAMTQQEQATQAELDYLASRSAS